MPTVLCTKLLSSSQKELFLNSGIGLVQYNAITTVAEDFSLPEENINNWIFTSKNAVKSYTKKENSEKRSKINAFCVGKKTAVLLKTHGFTIVETGQNAAELGQKILKNHAEKSFLHLSGDKRREELPALLKKNNIQYNEVVTYRTLLEQKRFNRLFDGILFFSPSGVQSFVAQNKLTTEMAFCIGTTTAEEVKKYTDKIIISSKPSVENVLVKAINYFNAKKTEKTVQ